MPKVLLHFHDLHPEVEVTVRSYRLDRIEEALKADIPSVRVTIHVEPDDEAKLPKGTAAVPFA